MTYRQPTRHDIGKTVEVRNNDREHWQKGVLRNYEIHAADDFTFWTGSNAHGQWSFWWECRVPVTSQDPIAELSVAADLLIEHGMDEAAYWLMSISALTDEQRNGLRQLMTPEYEQKDFNGLGLV